MKADGPDDFADVLTQALKHEQPGKGDVRTGHSRARTPGCGGAGANRAGTSRLSSRPSMDGEPPQPSGAGIVPAAAPSCPQRQEPGSRDPDPAHAAAATVKRDDAGARFSVATEAAAVQPSRDREGGDREPGRLDARLAISTEETPSAILSALPASVPADMPACGSQLASDQAAGIVIACEPAVLPTATQPVPPIEDQGRITETGRTSGNQTAASPADQLRPVLHANLGRDGSHRVTVLLHPADLGRVDIRIERSRDGSISVDLQVDRTETLKELVHRRDELVHALAQTGIAPEKTVLTIATLTAAPPNSSPESERHRQAHQHQHQHAWSGNGEMGHGGGSPSHDPPWRGRSRRMSAGSARASPSTSVAYGINITA